MSCAEHRDSQILMALRRRLENESLKPTEREILKEEISRLEIKLGLS